MDRVNDKWREQLEIEDRERLVASTGGYYCIYQKSKHPSNQFSHSESVLEQLSFTQGQITTALTNSYIDSPIASRRPTLP